MSKFIKWLWYSFTVMLAVVGALLFAEWWSRDYNQDGYYYDPVSEVPYHNGGVGLLVVSFGLVVPNLITFGYWIVSGLYRRLKINRGRTEVKGRDFKAFCK